MKFKDVVDNLNILKLDKMANCLSEYVDKVNSENIPFLEALYQLTKLEIANKAERSSQFNIELPTFHTIELLTILIFLFNLLSIRNKFLN